MEDFKLFDDSLMYDRRKVLKTLCLTANPLARLVRDGRVKRMKINRQYRYFGWSLNQLVKENSQIIA